MSLGKHLLGTEGLGAEEITLILDTAERMAEISARPLKKVPALRAKLVVNLFFENSTRTRSSFEIAEKRLSADTLNFSASTSSVQKGETLVDTVLNLERMMPDCYVMRHSSPGAHQLILPFTKASVVNAGDGAHEHPTQALLDAFTIRQKKGGFKGLEVLICGDIAHSRVVRSNIHLLKTMGAKVTLCSPATLMPPHMDSLGVKVLHDFDEALAGKDVVMMLRMQLERQQKGLFPSLREYYQTYGLTEERLKRASSDVIVMHPGPINRGVEIASEVADGPYSVILDQVENGVSVRMAVLYLLLGGGEDEASH
ncbi:MAG: aspartate carbamoyltransferase catalytic subunit [Acidobacteria bacterium]|jgi:aspartate carbamoyltransferase catalytic subunit|nr:aspartate carbamoyltransferase catalytic subunit [Acidobacteriota bacterium]